MLPFANYNIPSPTMRDKDKPTTTKRRKKRWPAALLIGGGGGADDLAVVKAAAWAWYQRNEGKPMMREFDLTSRSASRSNPRPTRYKLEATKKMILSENRVLAEHRVSKSSLWYDDDDTKSLYSHLLDTYEIESISKRIVDDLLPGSFPVSPTSVFLHDHHHDYDDDDDGHHVFVERKISCDHSNGSDVNGFVKKVNKRKFWRGMMLMVPSTVCGRSDDVDLRASQPGRRTGKLKVAAATAALVRAATRTRA